MKRIYALGVMLLVTPCFCIGQMTSTNKTPSPHSAAGRRILVVVDEQLGKYETVDLRQIVTHILDEAGFSISSTNVPGVQYTLEIIAKGAGIGANYRPINPPLSSQPSEYLVVGAELSGTILLTTPSGNYRQTFSGSFSPPEMTVKGAGPAYGAALSHSDFIPAFTKVLSEGLSIDETTVLISMLDDPPLADVAKKRLVKIGGQAVNPLIVALTHTNSSVRASAASALRELKDRRAVKPLTDTLRTDKSSMVRVSCVWALADLNETDGIAEVIKDSDTYLRLQALEALAYCKDFRAMEPLLQVLKDPNFNQYVKGRAADQLKSLTGQTTFADDVQKWTVWWEENKARLMKNR